MYFLNFRRSIARIIISYKLDKMLAKYITIKMNRRIPIIESTDLAEDRIMQGRKQTWDLCIV